MIVLKKKKGFSLLELTLVLGIGTMVAFMKFQDMKNEQEQILAKAVGQQIKQIGDAVNSYVNIRYNQISTLSNAAGTGTDPGPRTCSGSICEITYQTLINEGLLPSTFTGYNVIHSTYKIILKIDGIVPNYVINGLITTSLPWNDGVNIRYDLLGKAMQSAGIDSGMTKSVNTASGYGGQWSETSTNFPNIDKSGLLAYRTGFNSALYSIYLRRDGTLPMTGNLNMGSQSIYNAQNITATGTTTSGIIRSIGDINAGNDIIVGRHAQVNGNIQVNGTLNSNNTVSAQTLYSRGETYTQNWFRTTGDGGIYFEKYGGGWNMTDANTIQAFGGKNIQTPAGIYGGYVTSSGNTDISGTMNSNITNSNYIHSNGNIDAAGTVNSTYVWASGNLNSNYVHSNGNIDAAGQVYGAGGVVSGGRTTVGEFLQINGVANLGWGCSPNGLQGRDASGAILSCINGVWNKGSSGSMVLTGNISNGQQIPLPNGYSQGQCQWSVSSSKNYQGMKPNYFAGQEGSADGNRIVRCGYWDSYTFYPSGQCSYIISCN